MTEINKHPLVDKAHEKQREKVRKFALEEVKPYSKKLDENAEFSPELARKLGDQGLLGMVVPKEYGGQAFDSLAYIISIEELAKVDSAPAATVAAHNSLGLSPIVTYGTPEQKEYFLPQLTTGEKLWAFGLTEATAGSDAAGIKTKAKLEDEHWLVNGSKKFITNSASSAASGITLLCLTNKEGEKNEYTALLVPRETEGYKATPIMNKMVWRSVDTGKIQFDNCKIPKNNLLGKQGKGINMMLETLDGGRLSIAAIGLGLAQGAFDMALKHAKNRKQFGQPIGKFQSIAFKLADMELKIELARNTLYKACWQKDNKLPYSKQAAMAKLYCSEIAKEIADEAMQIHGAYGLMKDHDIERFYRDQRILQIGEGTSEILRLVISRQMGI